MLLSNTDFVTQLVKTISAAFIFMLMYFHEFSFPRHDMKENTSLSSQHAG